jgi:hypothetical protein
MKRFAGGNPVRNNYSIPEPNFERCRPSTCLVFFRFFLPRSSHIPLHIVGARKPVAVLFSVRPRVDSVPPPPLPPTPRTRGTTSRRRQSRHPRPSCPLATSIHHRRRLRPAHLGPHLVAATPGPPARLSPACKLDRGTKSPSASSSSGQRTKARLLAIVLASLVALSLIRPGVWRTYRRRCHGEWRTAGLKQVDAPY